MEAYIIDFNPYSKTIEGMINVRAINLDNVGALVIGTNREARKTDLEETVDILENLQDHMDCEMIGKTNFAAFFPKGREVDVQGDKFLVGSMIVLKVTEYGLEPLEENDYELAKNELESRHISFSENGKKVCGFQAELRRMT